MHRNILWTIDLDNKLYVLYFYINFFTNYLLISMDIISKIIKPNRILKTSLKQLYECNFFHKKYTIQNIFILSHLNLTTILCLLGQKKKNSNT